MKLRTEVAITGANEPPRADIVFDGRGGLLWTITAHGRRVVIELTADEAVQMVPVLTAAGPPVASVTSRARTA